MEENKLAVAFTGHRPNALGGYNENDFLNLWIKKELFSKINQALSFGVRKFITGGALGVDTWAAEIVLGLKEQYPDIVHVLAVPFPSQARMWNEETKERWQRIYDQSEVVVVSDDPYEPYKMQVRNEWMVNNASTLIAVLRGSSTKGGTYNCVWYAEKAKCKIKRIDPDTAPDFSESEHDAMIRFMQNTKPQDHQIYAT